MDALEAYETLRLAELLHERLNAATAAVANKRVISQEKQWLQTARDLLAAGRTEAASTIERARMLPELLEVRAELASTVQQHWVDALEKLLAGITFQAGSRAPLIETMFPHQKFPALRKAAREAVAAYQADFERRLKLSYVQRMLQDESYAFMGPCVEAVAQRYGEWNASFSSDSMDDALAEPIRKELIALGEQQELLCRQAKLLAEAALLPIEGAFEEHGLSAKARKRQKPKKVDAAPSAPEPEPEPVVEAKEEAPAPEAPPEAAPAASKKSKKDRAAPAVLPSA